MDENELRSALRTTMAHHPEPPPMQSSGVLVAARRAARRRNLLASAGGAAALVAVTAVVIPAQNLLGTSGGTSYEAAAPAASTNPAAEPSAIPVPPEAPQRSGRPLPSGVTEVGPLSSKNTWPAEASGDATFDSGGRYQKGRALLADLLEVVPAGYTTPQGTAPDGIPHQSHQATVEDDGFAYLASAAVAKGGGTGRLLVEVHAAGNDLPSDPCSLARSFWSMGGRCVVEEVDGGVKVGVADSTGDRSIDQGAAYRHDDGTVVFVAQAKAGASAEGVEPGLTELPLGVPDLAELATDKRFRLQ